MLQDAIRKLVAGNDLSEAEAANVASALADGSATPSQIGGLLIALRIKGETVNEVVGFARTMRERVVPVRPKRTPLLDTCGTGGSSFRVFNVSTAVAFVCAAAGVAVAKHGNRAVTGVCGSIDLLEALGVEVSLTPEETAECIDEVGVGFLFVANHHPSAKRIAGPRRELGVRTIFNLIGPLTNPAAATRQVMGVYAEELCPLAVRALQRLGSERACVVHGAIGLDEISTIGPTRVCELVNGEIVNYVLTPNEVGIDDPEPGPADLAPAREASANADLFREVLSGNADDRGVRARRDLIAVNAAAALRVCGVAEDWRNGVELARDLIASGKALDVLERLVAFSQAIKAR